MFSVGSVGTVDPHDISKVVFAGSIVQLGLGIIGPEPSPVAAAHAVTLPQVSATLRYPVPESVNNSELGGVALQLRYRDGSGHVVASLIEVEVPRGPTQPGGVVEHSLLQFDSRSFGGPSTSFRTHLEELPLGSDQFGHVLDLGANAYYIALTLTGQTIVVGSPPAVSSLGIVGRSNA